MDSKVSDGSRAATHDARPHHSRLCCACLSALTREGLETHVLYPHHDSIQSFIEAKNRQCYVCAYMFRLLPEEVRDSFGLLAEGTVPDHLLGRGSTPDLGGVHVVGGLSWSKMLPGVSFTGLVINTVWDSEGGEVTSIQFCLMPKHKDSDSCLRHLTIPEDFNWAKWRNEVEMARHKLDGRDGPIIIKEQGVHTSRLITRRLVGE